MFKREVYKRLTQQGDLNKWTDLSLFDSDIVSVKAKQYGYNLAVCRTVYSPLWHQDISTGCTNCSGIRPQFSLIRGGGADMFLELP